MHCPWGKKAFRFYLGESQAYWRNHDATALIEDGHQTSSILIDQGLNDQFLPEQLHPGRLEEACEKTGQQLTLRYHPGYDHSYYFISTFIGDHLRHHRDRLDGTL
jgi:S-formylglutathione hydrolase